MRTYALSEPVNGHHTWHDGKRYAWLLGLLVAVAGVAIATRRRTARRREPTLS